MQIRKCKDEEIICTGEFYDNIVKYLDEHINYPRWIYQVYPSIDSVMEMTKEKSQYICIYDKRIIGAFVLNNQSQGKYSKGKWSKDLPEESYMVIHALAIDHVMQGCGIASKIFKFSIGKAKEEGYESIRVNIVPDNIPAKKLFEKKMDLNMLEMLIWN